MAAAAQSGTEPLTEASPEIGTISVLDMFFAEAEHWVEKDGVHVLRGTEFDVIAGDPDFDRAMDQFFEKTQDLWIYLSGLEEITENENETFLVVAPRFHKLYKELERREASRREQIVSFKLNLKRFRTRQRGEHLRNWRPQSKPASASRLSHA
jgi:hypothetical protein